MQRFIGISLILAAALIAQGQQAAPPTAPAAPAAAAPATPPPATPGAMITRDQLAVRLEQLQAGEQQALANLQAIDGAIQECKHWLDQLASEDAAAKKAADKPPGNKAPATNAEKK